MADEKQPPPSPAEKSEESATEKDPHGVAVGKGAAKDQPKGMPNSDRHETEAAADPATGT